jgi:hypothetical protein
LWNADIARKMYGLELMDVVFVWHRGDSAFNLPYINEDSFEHFFYNIAIEATRLFGSIGNVLSFSNRRSFHDFLNINRNYHNIYPSDYDCMYPIEHRDDRPASYWYSTSAAYVLDNPSLLSLRIPEESTKLVRDWLSRFIYPDVPVSITLRECDPVSRASNIIEWQKLVDYYYGFDIKFIILRDYVKVYEEPVIFGSNVLYWDAPVLSLSTRAALYQECVLNLFVLNGPAMLAHLNRLVNYIVFKFHTVGGTGICAPSSIEKVFGIKEPDNFIGASKYQKVVWEPDAFEVMRNHTDNMIETLNNDGLWR